MHSYSRVHTGNYSTKRFSRIADLFPVLLLLLIGIINGMFYKEVIISETAHLVIIFNFLCSALIILYCIRRGFLFSRRLPEVAKKMEVKSFLFLSPDDTSMGNEGTKYENNADVEAAADINSKSGMKKEELLKGEYNAFIRDQHKFFKEVTEHTNTFLN